MHRRPAHKPLSRVVQSAPAYQLGDVATVELSSNPGATAAAAATAARQAKAEDAAKSSEQLRGGLVPVVELRDGCVLVDGVPLLSGLPASMYQRPNHRSEDSAATATAAAAQQGGVMLGVNFALEDKSVVAVLDDPAAGWRAKGAASLRKVSNCCTFPHYSTLAFLTCRHSSSIKFLCAQETISNEKSLTSTYVSYHSSTIKIIESPPQLCQVLRRARRAQHDVLLGKLRSNKVLAASRIKRWWMAPSWPLAAGEVPIETQFALVGLPNDAGYAASELQ